MDKWDRKTNFNCDSCMYYVPNMKGISSYIGMTRAQFLESCPDGRVCRRNAPATQGYPVVHAQDWCGEHKIGSNPVRDGKEGHKPPVEAKTIEELNEVHREVIKETEPEETGPEYYCIKGFHTWGTQNIIKDLTPIAMKICPNCVEILWKQVKGSKEAVTKEDVRKVLDEPLTNPAWDQPLVSTDKTLQEKAATAYYFCVKCDSAWGKVTNEPGEYKTCPKCEEKAKVMLEEEPDDNRKKETITAVYPVDLEEKVIIKRRIREQCDFLLTTAFIVDSTKGDSDTKIHTTEIKELLEKL